MANYELVWVEKGWSPDSSAVIDRVVNEQGGHLSGTCKLVGYGTANQRVAEVYFQHGERPRVVAEYRRVSSQL